jgi:hypothetical protein
MDAILTPQYWLRIATDAHALAAAEIDQPAKLELEHVAIECERAAKAARALIEGDWRHPCRT